MMEFGLFLLQGIPEMAGLIGLSLALIGVSQRWGRILLAGLLLAVLIYFIRLLPVTFGIHSLIGILLLSFLIIKTTNAPPLHGFLLASLPVLLSWSYLKRQSTKRFSS